MMKFKEFLTEAEFKPNRPNKHLGNDLTPYVKRLDNSILKLIESDEEPPLYRGGVGTLPNDNLNYFLKSSINLSQPRKSANTTNEFTILTSELLTSWKMFPKRSQSFICTTSYDTAENYGDIFVVLPLDNPDIAICPANDMWYSFRNDDQDRGPIEINSIFQRLHRLLNKQDIFLYDKTVHDKTSLKKLISEIETKIVNEQLTMKDIIDAYAKHNVKPEKELIDFFKQIKASNSIIEIMDSWLDPSKHGFEVVKFKRLINHHYKDREAWFSGEAIFVHNDYYQEFRMKIMGTQG